MKARPQKKISREAAAVVVYARCAQTRDIQLVPAGGQPQAGYDAMLSIGAN